MQQSLNPWVTGPDATDEAPASHPTYEPAAAAISAPLKGMDEPDAADRLQSRTMSGSAALWVTGAHGGAGETRIADLLDGARATSHCWPVIQHSASPRVLLACRSDVRGLTAGQTALTQWASGAAPDVDLLGLVILADAPGRMPKALREFASLVGGGAPRYWLLPWVEEWRQSPSTSVPSGREFQRFTKDLAILAADNSPSTSI